MAARFYIKAVMEYSAFAERAAMHDDVLIHPISVVRSWQAADKISQVAVEEFTGRIKAFLIEGLEAQLMDGTMKMATKIQILEL